jgi:hypothetical protein
MNNFLKVNKFLGLSVGIVISMAFFFASSSICLASESIITENTDVSAGIQFSSVIQTFNLPTSEFISGIRLRGGATTEDDVTVNLCIGTPDLNTEYGCGDDLLVIALHCTPPLNDFATTTCSFEKQYYFEAGTDFYVKIESDTQADTIVLTKGYSVPYSYGTLYTWGGANFSDTGHDLSFKLMLDDAYVLPDYDTVEIIETPTSWENVTVQIGSQYFNVREHTFCQINNACFIDFWYHYDDVGDMVLLYEKDESDVENFIDVIENLEDNPLLTDHLQVATSSEVGTEYFQVYQIPDEGSTTLHYYQQVHWISSTTEDSVISGFVINMLKDLFPFSIGFDVYYIFKNAYDSHEQLEKINITMQDIIPEEYSGYAGNETILNYDLVQNTTTIWDTYILEGLKYLVWLLTLFYIIARMRSVITTNTEQ